MVAASTVAVVAAFVLMWPDELPEPPAIVLRPRVVQSAVAPPVVERVEEAPPPAPPLASAPAVAKAAPALHVVAPAKAKVGEKVEVTVDAAVPEGATDFAFTLRYDPATWKPVACDQGRFMAEANVIARLRCDAHSRPGTVDVTLQQDGGAPSSGSASLVVFTFEAIAASKAPSRIAVSDIVIGNSDGGPSQVIAATESTVTVSP